MSRISIVVSGCAALLISVCAHAQLTSVDGGAAFTDNHGLMFASTVGIDMSWSNYPTGLGDHNAPGSAQAWVAGLNATDYGGYSDWTLATGVGTVSPNSTSNQLGELFNVDCGFAVGGSSVGSSCGKFTSLNTVLRNSMVFFSDSAWAGNRVGPTPITSANEFNGDFNFWGWNNLNNSPLLWTDDTSLTPTGGMPLVGMGDAIAVRKTVSAPEIDPSAMVGGVSLLAGLLLVLRGRKSTVSLA